MLIKHFKLKEERGETCLLRSLWGERDGVCHSLKTTLFSFYKNNAEAKIYTS